MAAGCGGSSAGPIDIVVEEPSVAVVLLLPDYDRRIPAAPDFFDGREPCRQ